MRFCHALKAELVHALVEATMRQTRDHDSGALVYLERGTRSGLARLSTARRAALTAGLHRVGSELLHSAKQVEVAAGWKRRTWPRRRYPQQCYARTTKYVLEHLEIDGARLVHGVVAHAPHFLPLAHAWVELPGDVVFDGVVQTFFTRSSYYRVMAALPLTTYSGVETQRLAAASGFAGPWDINSEPTPDQLHAYMTALRQAQEDASTEVSLSAKVGRKR
jgi:hypothetical protein